MYKLTSIMYVILLGNLVNYHALDIYITLPLYH